MKRFAAHYIFIPPNQTFKLHCVELDDKNRFSKVFPLEKEIANTSFFNGVLFLSNNELSDSFLQSLENFQQLENLNLPKIKEKDMVFIYHLDNYGTIRK
jgi:hypothetical protein